MSVHIKGSSLDAENLARCTVCSIEFDDNEEADLYGYFGMIPVAFCATCTSCLMDLAQQLAQIAPDEEQWTSAPITEEAKNWQGDIS